MKTKDRGIQYEDKKDGALCEDKEQGIWNGGFTTRVRSREFAIRMRNRYSLRGEGIGDSI